MTAKSETPRDAQVKESGHLLGELQADEPQDAPENKYACARCGGTGEEPEATGRDLGIMEE